MSMEEDNTVTGEPHRCREETCWAWCGSGVGRSRPSPRLKTRDGGKPAGRGKQAGRGKGSNGTFLIILNVLFV